MNRLFWLVVAGLLLGVEGVAAQNPSTPIPVNPPTSTATAPPPTEPPTRTPTSLGPASLRALTDGTNVRAQPDIAAERVGQINPIQSYMVIARYFEWYQIQYPDTPNGVGWVHQSVVELIGEASLIPDLSNADSVPTVAPPPAPEGTAESNSAAGSGPIIGNPIGGENAPQVNQPENRLPTFTFPAASSTPLNLAEIGSQQKVAQTSGGMAPIIPFLGLIGIGLLGSLLTLMRR